AEPGGTASGNRFIKVDRRPPLAAVAVNSAGSAVHYDGQLAAGGTAKQCSVMVTAGLAGQPVRRTGAWLAESAGITAVSGAEYWSGLSGWFNPGYFGLPDVITPGQFITSVRR